MKKFFCYGKKDFCENTDLCIECPHFAGAGGDYREAPMTNADRIRGMSDEELAKLLCCTGWRMIEQKECLEWLQQPSGEEDKHETD